MLAEREASPEELLNRYEVTPDDLAAIRALGKTVLPRIGEYIDGFYAWLLADGELKRFFTSADRLRHVQNLQGDYWRDFFAGRVDEAYIAKRREVGEAHARIGLPLPAYFAAMSVSLRLLTETIPGPDLAGNDGGRIVRAVTRLLHLDTAVVVETFARRTARIIAEQHESMQEMSTPVTEIWDDVLLLPIVGIIDSRRAQDVRTAVLAKIAETRARSLILDISGVAIVDTAVANHLLKITRASRLMGCACIISGVSPAIAETVVDLGIDVGDVVTTATLRDALRTALRASGLELKEVVKRDRA
jgi:rsbT co-antagonist protein RsbR